MISHLFHCYFLCENTGFFIGLGFVFSLDKAGAKIMDYMGISSVDDLALNHLNYKAPQEINRLKDKGSSPSFKMIKDRVNAFEEVDPSWLLTAKSVLKEEKHPPILTAH